MIQHYPGHAFSVDLARQLARMGHATVYVHCPSFTAPRGDLRRATSDPATFSIEEVVLGGSFAKYSPFRRVLQEVSYGRLLNSVVRRIRPDVVLSANLLLSEAVFVSGCRRSRVPYVPWVQDIFGTGIRRVLRRRLGPAASALGAAFEGIEGRNLRAGARVVSISEDFASALDRFGVPAARVTVIPNWAAIERIPPMPQRNAWSEKHGLAGRTVALYSGTLGLKHDPRLLLRLAERLTQTSDAVVVVVSEGAGARWLEEHRPASLAERLILLPYQSIEDFPAMLASASVLLAVLEPEAGTYSVPSKVLAYLCAGRPIVAAIPPDNLSARLVESVGAGHVSAPGDACAFSDAVAAVLEDGCAAQRMGEAGRKYAEAHFPIGAVAERFEEVLTAAAAS